jgi:hypothetical protein
MRFCNHEYIFSFVDTEPTKLKITVACEHCVRQAEFEVDIQDFLDLISTESDRILLTWDSERDKEV